MVKIAYKEIVLQDPAGKLTDINNRVVFDMEYNASVCNTLAINEVLNAWAVMQDRKDILRHEVKRFAPKAADLAEQYRKVALQYMKNRERMDRFTDGIVDIIADDMHMLRALVKKELSENGCREVELTAWVEVARIMLIIATNNFDVIIKSHNDALFARQAQLLMAAQKLPQGTEERTRADRIYAIAKSVNYARSFSVFRLTDLLQMWSKVADRLDPNAVSIVSHPVEEVLHHIGYDFANNIYTVKCMQKMAEQGDEFFTEAVKWIGDGTDNEK